MAAVSAVAEKPHRIDKFMISDDKSDAGIYAVNMYSVGVPFTEIIDDNLPMYGSNTIFAGKGKDGSIWGAIVEKAFAKYYGNWERLVGGWMAYAVSALNGGPFSEYWHTDYNADEIWNILRAADLDNDIITAGSQFCGSHDNSTE